MLLHMQNILTSILRFLFISNVFYVFYVFNFIIFCYIGWYSLFYMLQVFGCYRELGTFNFFLGSLDLIILNFLFQLKIVFWSGVFSFSFKPYQIRNASVFQSHTWLLKNISITKPHFSPNHVSLMSENLINYQTYEINCFNLIAFITRQLIFETWKSITQHSVICTYKILIRK